MVWRSRKGGEEAMKQAIHSFSFTTTGKGLTEITDLIRAWLDAQGIETGLLTLFCRHTSASLTIQENADSDVRIDLEEFYETIAPEDPARYVHNLEGPDDMPAHIRASLTDVSLSIPVSGGQMVLGTWQGIYLFEHRAMPHSREVVVHVIGE
jgi:secondary thiamine-phosphate synthase enzyme